MQRPAHIAAFLLLIASIPLSAQRGGGHGSFGGGHASGGAHSGFSAHSGFAGHAGGSHAAMGMRSRSGFSGRTSARGSSFHRSFDRRGLNHFRDHDRDRFRFRTFGNDCFGLGCGFSNPYLWGGIDPYWWWEGSSYDQDQQNEVDMANQMNAQSLEEQRMRQQQDDPPGDQDAYAHSAPPQQRQVDTQPSLATVLVFRDQHKQEVQNYAIVGQTLWTFAPQHQKIPLSDLDLPATTRANEERGVDFRIPGANEGQ